MIALSTIAIAGEMEAPLNTPIAVAAPSLLTRETFLLVLLSYSDILSRFLINLYIDLLFLHADKIIID